MKLKFAFLLSMLSAPAFAEGLSIKPEIIYSQSQIQVGNEKITRSNGESFEYDAANTKFLEGYGGALNLEYALTDRVHVGSGVGYLQYDKPGKSPKFKDLFLKSQLSYDFVKAGDFSGYGLTGVSYHMLDLDSEDGADYRVQTGDVQVWNYDLGVGGRLQASEKVSLGLEYRVTNTFDSDRLRSKLHLPSEEIRSEMTKVKLNTSEVIASLVYAL